MDNESQTLLKQRLKQPLCCFYSTEVQLAAAFFWFSDFTNWESQNGSSVGGFATIARYMAKASVRLV